MTRLSKVRIYCEVVFVLGCLCVWWLLGRCNLRYVTHDWVAFSIFAGGMLLGEMMPVKIPRRGSDEELTFSAPFALALLLIGGIGPALLAQCVVSAIQDVTSRKPLWRLRFNLGQYVIAMTAANLVIRATTMNPSLDSTHPFRTDQLPATMLGILVFFAINTAVVGVAVALYQKVPVNRYFRADFGLVLGTGGALVVVSPVVLATASCSVAILPLCIAPIVALYIATVRGTRSEHAARHDPLTGLPNRAAFYDAVPVAKDEPGTQACVLLLDLDRFKEVNDTLGHHCGDQLLIAVAARLREAAGPDVVIARLGGDEFAVVSRGRDRAAACELAESLTDRLCAPFELGEIALDVQGSIGISLFPDHGSGAEVLLQKADVAMYHAKETRTNWSLYEERHDHNRPEKLALTAALRAALEGNEIVPWYQPQVDLVSGEVVAVEALARWRHPVLGLLQPGAFIGVAEQKNLIKPLTRHILDASLRQLASWRAQGIELAVAVNVSPQVLIDQRFADDVVAALQQTSVPPTLLKLEVTESALMADPVVARAVLAELSSHGVQISIDDFGTGYSSLSYLADLPVCEMKIDRSFVAAINSGVGKRIIVSSTIDLAHNLGLRVVAEGVREPKVLDELISLGCDVAQGFALGRPMPGADLPGWMSSFQRNAHGLPIPVDRRSCVRSDLPGLRMTA